MRQAPASVVRGRACPCGQRLLIRPDEVGLDFRCPTCGRRMVMDEPTIDRVVRTTPERVLCNICHDGLVEAGHRCTVCGAGYFRPDGTRRATRHLPPEARARRRGAGPGVVETFRDLALRPADVFEDVVLQRGRALGYALPAILGVAGFGCAASVVVVGALEGPGAAFAMFIAAGTAMVWALVRPLLFAIGLSLSVAVFPSGRRHLGGRFRTTYRISMATLATTVVAWVLVPPIGFLIDLLWAVPLAAVGLREVHGMPPWAAVTSSIAGVVFLVCSPYLGCACLAFSMGAVF